MSDTTVNIDGRAYDVTVRDGFLHYTPATLDQPTVVYDGGLIAVESPADDAPRKINFREFL